MKRRKGVPTKKVKSMYPDRTLEQVRNQYLVEKELAERIKRANRDERKIIYHTMYDELFDRVPDHPRLRRRRDERMTELVNRDKMLLVRRFIDDSTIFAEFAPGDCRFSFEIAKYVKRVIAIDISDQRNPDDPEPENFELIVYNGFDLDEVSDASVDVVFSDQLIEHFHPEDTKYHFELVLRILKPGGKYIFRTPHSLLGPHDISARFSDEPEGLHLKEWSYMEILELLKAVEYTGFQALWHKRNISLRMPYLYYLTCEMILNLFPKRATRPIAKYLIPYIYGVAVK